MSQLVAAPTVDGSASAPNAGWRLRTDRGQVLPLPVARWLGDAEPAEEAVLGRALPPVLDVGCGPARHTRALRQRGIPALGIDVAPTAVRIASDRGAPALCRSVFQRLPREGGWGSALLLDGNVGIGGDPVRLFSRLQQVVRPGGRVLVEVESPGTPSEAFRVAIESDRGVGDWFPWARVGADDLWRVAEPAGLDLQDLWTEDGRWFAHLDVP